MPHKIFICDDNDNDVALLLHSFTTAGFEPDTMRARDGEEAIQYLETDPKLNLVILDHRLPRKSGPEVIEHLRNVGHFPTCPVVLLTSRLGKEHEALNAKGVHAILEKPFSLDDYLKVGVSLANMCR